MHHFTPIPAPLSFPFNIKILSGFSKLSKSLQPINSLKHRIKLLPPVGVFVSNLIMNFLLTFSSSSGCTFPGSFTRAQTFSQPRILSLTPWVFPLLSCLTLLCAVYCQICSQGSSLSPSFYPLFSMVDWHFKRCDFLAANFTVSVNQYIMPLHLLPLTQQLILTSILKLMTAYWAGNFSIILSISFFLFQMYCLPRANDSVFTISLTSFHIFPQPHLGFSGLPWLIPPNDLFSAARENFPLWAHHFRIQKAINSTGQTITQKLWFSWHVGCPTVGPLLFLPVFPSTVLPLIAQSLVQVC